MELYKGRPEDTSGRLEREIRTYDFLDKLGMTYWRTDHADQPAGSMEACNDIDVVLGVLICKNLFLCNRQRTSFYLLLMPGDKPFKTKELSAQINSSRLSFGSAEEMEELLCVSPGSVSVMGLMNDPEHRVRLLIDEDVLKEEYFGCHPCINTSSLKMYTKELIEKFLPATGHEPTIVHLTGESRSLKVSPAFSKAAGCRGRALARAPQSAELSCAYLSAGGGLRGNPRRGFPLFFTLLRVRRYVGRGSLACPAFRPHFFGACPKKRCRAAKEKRFFTLAAPPSA